MIPPDWRPQHQAASPYASADYYLARIGTKVNDPCLTSAPMHARSRRVSLAWAATKFGETSRVRTADTAARSRFALVLLAQKHIRYFAVRFPTKRGRTGRIPRGALRC